MIKPLRLRPGSRVGICAPSSYIDDRVWFDKGIATIEGLGLKPVLPKGLFRKKRYLAGDDLHRSAILNSLFGDNSIDAVFFARGGTGMSRILDLLDWKLIRSNPKVVMGYSDITALNLALWQKHHMVSFSGPMITRGWDTAGVGIMESFTEVLSGVGECVWKFKQSEFKVYSSGIAEGRLIGGNLTTLCGIIGTPYMPRLKDSILFLEDVDETPENVDRMLSQLKLAGILDSVKAVLLGDFAMRKKRVKSTAGNLRFALESYFKGMKIPVIGNLPFGHLDDMIILPVGVRARLDTGKRTLKLLERAVKLR